ESARSTCRYRRDMWMPRASGRFRLTKALTRAPLLSVAPSSPARATGISISPMPTQSRAPAWSGRASAAMSGITRAALSWGLGATAALLWEGGHQPDGDRCRLRQVVATSTEQDETRSEEGSVGHER